MSTAAQNEFNELMRNKERRSKHPEDDARSFLNLSDDDEEDRTPSSSRGSPDESQARPSMSNARHVIPRTRYGANTGPKGVISDAQHYRDSQRVQQRSAVSESAQLPRQTEQTLWSRDQPITEKQSSLSDDEFEDDGADGDFMDQWRQSRLRELQTSGYESKMHSRGRSRRLYGGMPTVDGDGYLEAVEKSGSDTVVVVYIYDDMSQVSQSVESCLLTLAQKHQDVRFVKLHYQDAEMEPAGVPALLAYRGGDKFAGLVPLMDEMPDDADFSALTLEAVLRRQQVLR